ncbi:hypothetical protein AnigIFM60653_011079 [Aspergillus niger]|nr:hypothetical protein AnigIFM60653_011079 [Aspergillus niger]
MSLWRATSSSTKSSSMGSDIPSTTSKITQNAQKFPTSGFDIIQPDEKVEEEELPDYEARHFYPVRLGEIFQNRYQVVAKLGFGSSATTWLSRDLTQDGTHTILIFEAAQMSLRDMKVVFQQGGFDQDLVKGAITELLQAVDFLHTQGQSVHTDIHPENLLLGAYDNQSLSALKHRELVSPVPRKSVSPTRTIYLSRLMRPQVGPMLLSDFGETRIGPGPHGGDIMPLEYRAPEILLHIGWSYPVDIWSAWDLLEPRKLFTVYLPSPPFSKKEPGKGKRFGGSDGKWLGLAPIPHDRTMERLDSRLSDKFGFLRFMRKTLTWLPEERATAKELLQDPWLRG